MQHGSSAWSALTAITAGVLAACTPGNSDTQELNEPSVQADARDQAVQDLFTDFHDNNETPFAGFSVTVMRKGEIVFSDSRGVMDVATQKAATPQTRYRIYSTSKSIAAVAAQRLAEQGRLDLDAPVGRYMPDLPDHIKPVTARQLMAHRAGVRHYNPGEWGGVSDSNCAGPREALGDFINDPLRFEPGTDMGYTTFGYVLLSAVIETAAEMPHDDAMRELIFAPAGMSATAIEGRPVPGFETATFYYTRDPTDPDAQWQATADDDPPVDASCKFGGGGFVSTSEDLARFGQALHDGTLLSSEGVAQLTEVVTKADQEGEPGYGRGFFDGEVWLEALSGYVLRENIRPSVPPIPDTDIWFHGGSASGGYSLIFVYPEYEMTAALAATNHTRGSNLPMLDLHEMAMQFVEVEDPDRP